MRPIVRKAEQVPKATAHNKKLDHQRTVSRDFLKARVDRAAASGYGKAQWIIFCETMLDAGYNVYLYEARQTFSKYVSVHKDGKRFKVRFSNHKPIKRREMKGDCDFFVGVTNLNVTTTKDAIAAVEKHFALETGK